MVDGPLVFVLSLAELDNTKAWQYIRSVLNGSNFVEAKQQRLTESVQREQGSKTCTYRAHNPYVEVNGVYRYTVCVVPEYQRMVYTRFRLSAHNLRIETGPWSRVPREARVCDCAHGGIQGELHVIKYCSKLHQLRQKYSEMLYDIPAFYDNCVLACQFIYEGHSITVISICINIVDICQ